MDKEVVPPQTSTLTHLEAKPDNLDENPIARNHQDNQSVIPREHMEPPSSSKKTRSGRVIKPVERFNLSNKGDVTDANTVNTQRPDAILHTEIFIVNISFK